MPQNVTDPVLLEYFENFALCGECFDSCKKTSGTFFCKLCRKYFHKRCEKGRNRTSYAQQRPHYNPSYACEKCIATVFPFYESDDVDLICALSGEGKPKHPCKKCKRDCLKGMKCFCCIVCNAWLHSDCYGHQLICSQNCYMKTLPFSNFKYQVLLDHNIFSKTKKTNVSPFKKCQKQKCVKKMKPAKFVPMDHFYNINCSYLSPNELEDAHLGCAKSELSVFQGNVRSLNANFDAIGDIFQNCQRLPDVLAITESKLKKDDNEPPMPGYRFEGTPTKTDFGGVGVYLSSDLKNYSIRKDLELEADHCEDIWVDVATDQPGKEITNVVIGIIYRHPNHHYDVFCEKLCNTINLLNATKTKYIIVGDINIDLQKFNLATDVTNYVNSLYSVGCNICIDQPTRVAKKSATCIDHIYSNLMQD